MIASAVTIKGTRDGLRLQIDEAADWPSVIDGLRMQLQRGSSFFQGATITLDIGERQLSEAELAELLSLMEQHGLRPAALSGSARSSRNLARAAGLAARPAERRSVEGVSEAEGAAAFITRTLRSGQLVRHPGHVTVLGDINPGAEIVAGGSILIWGRLRGSAHAGALGDRTALVAALEFVPSQLRIADLLLESQNAAARRPELARIEDERIIVEAWEGYRR